MPDDETTLLALSRHVRTLRGAPSDYSAIAEEIGDARFVLLGEATHGTHEFYELRAALTRELILRGQCAAVITEADWPAMHAVDRWIRSIDASPSAHGALAGFQRFPRWMWANEAFANFTSWLRDYNTSRAPEEQVPLFGLDLYSLYESISAVIDHLEHLDAAAADRARQRYACLEPFSDDPRDYGFAAASGLADCEDQVVAQLRELGALRAETIDRDGFFERDAAFIAEQNAFVARNAERYYRSIFRGAAASWNLRDLHMAETVDRVAEHLAHQPRRVSLHGAPVVVWAHNSHVGDARATQMTERGEYNLGQLLRQTHEDAVYIVGFTTWAGRVTAASRWGDPGVIKAVRDALPGSVEDLFHRLDEPTFFLSMRGSAAADHLRCPRLERAIGVIYRPQTERQSHYFWARPADQFDAIIHVDSSTGVVPTHPHPTWRRAHQELGSPESPRPVP